MKKAAKAFMQALFFHCSDLMNYLESVENDKESGSESGGGQSSNGTAMPILNRSPMNSKYVVTF